MYSATYAPRTGVFVKVNIKPKQGKKTWEANASFTEDKRNLNIPSSLGLTYLHPSNSSIHFEAKSPFFWSVNKN